MHTERQPHVLIIDDQPEMLGSLIKMLENHQFRVSQAVSARTGYQRALALNPDVILLDLYMPVMDGFAVCRLLRESTLTHDVPVLFISATATTDERLEGFDLGAVDFIAKPFVPEEVLARVRVALRMSPRTEQRQVQHEISTQETLSQDHIILQAAITLIESNLVTPPSLAELSKAVGTYEKRLLRIFRARLDTTVFGYIRQARLSLARKLLRNDQISIEEVAAQTGFSSASNFSTAFRASEGISPSQYRRVITKPGAQET